MSYEDELKSPRWYYVRERILERDNYRCTECHSERSLQVHHKYYILGRKAWDYKYEALVTLCDRCHKIAHDKAPPLDRLEMALAKLVIVAGYGVRDWCQKQFPKEEDGKEIH